MIHIVTIGTQRYAVDVGMGPTGPSAPLALDESSAVPTVNVVPQMRRLRKTLISEVTCKVEAQQALWVYEVQHDPAKDSPWLPQYCFSELEFLAADFELFNFYTSQSPKSWFRHHALCSKQILEGDQIIGSIICFGPSIKRREHGKVTFELDLKSEDQRTEALEKYLDVKLTSSEKAAISGYPSQISV